MYTLEINGTALVVTNADEPEARALLESEDFKSDLKTLTAEGRPLWDGSAPLNIRKASESEVEAFEEALNDDDYEDEDDEEDEEDEDEEQEDGQEDEPIDIVFLVEIDEADEDDSASA
jgi:hypothetical protein